MAHGVRSTVRMSRASSSVRVIGAGMAIPSRVKLNNAGVAGVAGEQEKRWRFWMAGRTDLPGVITRIAPLRVRSVQCQRLRLRLAF